jgi:hypothetical protein
VVLARCGAHDVLVPVVSQNLNRELTDGGRTAPDQDGIIAALRRIALSLRPWRLKPQIGSQGVKDRNEVVRQRDGLRERKAFGQLNNVSMVLLSGTRLETEYLRQLPLVRGTKLLLGFFGLRPPSEPEHLIANFQSENGRPDLDYGAGCAVTQNLRMLD